VGSPHPAECRTAQSSTLRCVHQVVGGGPVGRSGRPPHHTLQGPASESLLAGSLGQGHGQTLDVVRIDLVCCRTVGRPTGLARKVGVEEKRHPSPRKREQLGVLAQQAQPAAAHIPKHFFGRLFSILSDHLLVSCDPEQDDRKARPLALEHAKTHAEGSFQRRLNRGRPRAFDMWP
jgi:hypothetical protein